MHRKPALRIAIPMPRVDAGLVVNLWALLSLAAVCVAIAFLTDWRWGVLTAGILGFAAAVYVSRQLPAAEPETADKVTPIRKTG